MTSRGPTPANRLQLDYRAEARDWTPPCPIIDVHTHVTGVQAAELYGQARAAFGVAFTYSMTPLGRLDAIRKRLDGRVRFIAIPDHRSANLEHAVTDGFIEQIRAFHAEGERLIKIWAAPRGRDLSAERGYPTAFVFDSTHNRRAMELAAELGMAIMVHIGDPDTWFHTKYADATHYGTKADQYVAFEQALDDIHTPFIAAHMGGWPEDLPFLSGLLERHPNLHLDTSATKWMVRELSKHTRDDLVSFLASWNGRILFGSDIVASDEHLGSASPGDPPVAGFVGTREEVFELYASRYWALRTLWETPYDGESPIADPDLALVDPDRYSVQDAPRLKGHSVPVELLRGLYANAASAVLDPLYG